VGSQTGLENHGRQPGHGLICYRLCHGGLARAQMVRHTSTGMRNSSMMYMVRMFRRRGRAAEGGGLLNRYRVVKPYRGFESLRLRQQITNFR
jgi:hypothetical protein